MPNEISHSIPNYVWLDLNPFIVFFLRSRIDVVRDISNSLSDREVCLKGGVTRVSPGKREQSL